jgi:hypothetical protein
MSEFSSVLALKCSYTQNFSDFLINFGNNKIFSHNAL